MEKYGGRRSECEEREAGEGERSGRRGESADKIEGIKEWEERRTRGRSEWEGRVIGRYG